MSLENIKELLSKFGWEYHIIFDANEYFSSRYLELTRNKVDENIFKYRNKYYENKSKSFNLNDINYKIEYLEDVTNYFEHISILKKDKITGLATREDLDDFISKLKRTNVFALCDIDDFKKVNDNYGHQIGDQVLNMLGTIIKENIRKNDFAGRYGGEEFLIIFDTDNVEIVKKRIDEINKIFNLKSKNLNLSFSAGISIYEKNKTTSKTIKEIDIALYYVKRNGKNGSIVYNKELEENITK